MNETEKIKEWQEKIKESYGDEKRLQEYLFETLDNFYYRYLETEMSKDLHTQSLGKDTWGARSLECNMVEALKTKNPSVKPGIMELAKRVPKADKPLVRYGLWVEVKELTPEHGKLIIVSEIHWGFPEFSNKNSAFQKKVQFEYQDVSEFRKGLALKLEAACEIFS